MKKLKLAFLLLFTVMGLFADDDPSELYGCSFTAHTPVGDLSGRCTTQSLPAPDFVARWAFTLTFDPKDSIAVAKIQPDTFYDMVRGQCLQDGSFTTVMPLWGDFVITPDDPDYIEGNKRCAPVYQTAPNKITLTQTPAEPFVLKFLYEQSPADFDAATGLPTSEWMAHYLDSFRRLQQNRQNSSLSATHAPPRPAVRTFTAPAAAWHPPRDRLDAWIQPGYERLFRALYSASIADASASRCSLR